MKTENRSLEVKAKIETRLIMVEGKFKALVLNMALVTGRLMYVGEGRTEEEAWNDAQDFVKAHRMTSGGSVWN